MNDIMAREKTDIRYKTIHGECDLMNLYDSLNMSGYWKDTHIQYLKSVYWFLVNKDKPVTPFEMTRLVGKGEHFAFDELMGIDYCKELLGAYMVSMYEKNAWTQITAMLEELVAALKILCPNWDIPRYPAQMFREEIWKSKIILAQTEPEILLCSSVLHQYLDDFFNENKKAANNGKNLFLIDNSFPCVTNELYQRNKNGKPFHIFSIREAVYSVRLNPLTFIEKNNYNIMPMADIITWQLIGKQDRHVLNIASNVIAGCLFWLEEKNTLSLPHLMAMLTMPVEILEDNLTKGVESQKYIPWMKKFLDHPFLQQIMNMLKNKASIIMNDKWCWMTAESDIHLQELMKKGHVLVVDGDKSQSLTNSVILECIRQHYGREYEEYQNGYEHILEPRNIIVVPNLADVKINRIDTIIGLRNFNPFRIIAGYPNHKEWRSMYDDNEFDMLNMLASTLCQTRGVHKKYNLKGKEEVVLPVVHGEVNCSGMMDKVINDVKNNIEIR